jgi:hypothetical protein
MTGSKSNTSSASLGSAISLARCAGSVPSVASAGAERANSGLAATNCRKRRQLAKT